MKPHAKKIVCQDGFEISVQASEVHYCEPREDYPGIPYTRVECGYPSSDPGEALKSFQEQPGRDPTDDVYPYVPMEIVEELIESHGGIANGWMPKY